MEAHQLLVSTATLDRMTVIKRNAGTGNETRKPRGNYRKLLWFKQPCQSLLIFHSSVLMHPVPDNYTDEKTFLDHLQRNPRLQPYEFWSLMADATVIVQHLASVAIFCCCFVAIIHGRVSPVAVVGWASLCTILAWVLWDHWMGKSLESSSRGIRPTPRFRHETSQTDSVMASSLSRRTEQRLATVKSAVLIYAAVLGLSPILKSLTRSTTSDSIWALSTWLLVINVAFFDYSGGSGAQYDHHSIISSWKLTRLKVYQPQYPQTRP